MLILTRGKDEAIDVVHEASGDVLRIVFKGNRTTRKKPGILAFDDAARNFTILRDDAVNREPKRGDDHG